MLKSHFPSISGWQLPRLTPVAVSRPLTLMKSHINQENLFDSSLHTPAKNAGKCFTFPLWASVVNFVRPILLTIMPPIQAFEVVIRALVLANRFANPSSLYSTP